MSADISFDRYVDLMKSHHGAAKRLSSVIASIPILEKRAARMANCTSITSGYYCPRCKTFHTVHASLCRDRLCPNCGWVLARRRAYAVAQAIEGIQNVFDPVVLHLVLTLKHDRTSDLSEQLNILLKGFGKLMRYKALSNGRIGFVRSVEVKHNTTGFHPHIHAMLIMDESYYDHMVDQKSLSKMWGKCCAVDYDPVVWIKQAYSTKSDDSISDAIYECVKYCIKTSEWEKMTKKDLLSAALAIHGCKLFCVGGKVFKREYMAALERIKNEDMESSDFDSDLCRKCRTKRPYVTLSAKEGFNLAKQKWETE